MSNETNLTPEPEVDPKSETEKTRRVIEEGLPYCIRHESQDVIDAVMASARTVLHAANPTNAVQAIQWRRALVGFFLHVYKTYGTVDVEMALTHDAIDNYVSRVNKEESLGWKRGHRSRLRQLAVIVNPQSWPKSEKLASHEPADIYSEDEEAAFRLAGELACFKKKYDEAFVVVGNLGAGLLGPETARVSPSDVVEITDGRLGIWVAHKNPRLVPVREAYTELLTELCGVAKAETFVHQKYRNAVHNVSTRVVVKGLERLSFPRGRCTWLTAHLRAGTSLDALWAFSGPLSINTLNGLVQATSLRLTPEEAALKGLRA